MVADVFDPGRKSGEAGGLNPLFVSQNFHPLDVHHAPVAPAPPRGETDLVTVVVDRSAEAINPAHAERFVDRFRPGDRGTAGVFLVEADPEFAGGRVVFLEPAPEGCRVREKNRSRQNA